MNEERVAALEDLFGRLERDDTEGLDADNNLMVNVHDALKWALPILRASKAPVVLDAEFIEDDDAILDAAHRRQEKRRLAAGLDPATGRPLQAPIVGVARTDAATVPSATSGILALVEGAAAGKVRLDPGKAPPVYGTEAKGDDHDQKKRH